MSAAPVMGRALARELAVDDLVDELRDELRAWLSQTEPELRETLAWQLDDEAKLFRPLVLFTCWRACGEPDLPTPVVQRALAIELIHNLTLVVDDILDRARYRRRKLTVHCRFGTLPALMSAGYVQADVFARLAGDVAATHDVARLLKRLARAECEQWRTRRVPRGVEDWRRLAGEDTGSMFEACAALASPDARLARFGHLLGVLYHGCDDVADVRGSAALGGGGHADVRDGILTLPAAIAVRDADVAARFAVAGDADVEVLGVAFRACLGDAEAVLDGLADEALAEAGRAVGRCEATVGLVSAVRGLAGC